MPILRKTTTDWKRKKAAVEERIRQLQELRQKQQAWLHAAEQQRKMLWRKQDYQELAEKVKRLQRSIRLTAAQLDQEQRELHRIEKKLLARQEQREKLLPLAVVALLIIVVGLGAWLTEPSITGSTVGVLPGEERAEALENETAQQPEASEIPELNASNSENTNPLIPSPPEESTERKVIPEKAATEPQLLESKELNIAKLGLLATGSQLLLVQTCAGEDSSATANNYAGACDGTYPVACPTDLLSCNDGSVETHAASKNTYAGVRIEAYNSSLADCFSITSVSLCYEWWSSSSAIDQCVIAIDADGGASYSNVTSTCPGTSADPGMTCTNVTSLESWTCSSFFGSSGTRALARTEYHRTNMGGVAATQSADALFFNVTYTSRDILPPSVTNLSPTANTIFDLSQAIEFAALVNDSDNVSVVAVNLTYPNSSIQRLPLVNSIGNKYNASFVIPPLRGTYTLTFIANDTYNDVNATETTSFRVDANFTYLVNSTTTQAFGWAAGTSDGVVFDGINNSLKLASGRSSGTFLSQVFDAENNASWNRVSWDSKAYGELPDNQANESSFISGNLDMRNNVLLMHLNEGSGTIQDASGKSNSGTVTGATYGASGRIGTALRFAKPGDRIDVASSSSLNITDGMAIVLWVNLAKTTHSSWNYFVYDTGFKYEFGIYATDMKPRFKPYNTAGTGFEVAAANTITTDRWYHVVALRNGTGVSVYVNGMQEAARNDFSGELRGNAGPVRIGGDTGSQYFNGTIDEVAIWNRSLTIPEIISLYERGLAILNVSVRSCDDANCSGESFTDIADTPSPALSLARNQYVQYNVSFATNDTAYTPELYNVTIRYSTDLTPPRVFDLLPRSGEVFNVSSTIEIGANATDAVGISVVLANITRPDSAVELLTLANTLNDKYNSSFTLPNITGRYNVTFLANDTGSNINRTETTFFVGGPFLNISLFTPTSNADFTQGQFNAFTVNVSCQLIVCGDINVTVYRTVEANRSIRVSTNSNDAEEAVSSGAVSLTSTDLELVTDVSTVQEVGMRFTNVNIPQGATIRSAYVQFTVDEMGSDTTNLVFYGEDIDNANIFSTATQNITKRTKTNASIAWNSVPAWNTIGAAGDDQKTPNLAAIIQEIVNRPGWAANQALAIIVNGSGRRTAVAYDGGAGSAPLLLVNFTTLESSEKVPTNSSVVPFYTNQSNPTTLTLDVNSSQLVTFWVNASGTIGTVSSFFASAALVNTPSIEENSSAVDITIRGETINPKVFALLPAANSTFNVSKSIEIGTNVTDNVLVSAVLANITLPNGTSQLLTLANALGDKYNTSFIIPEAHGQYNITFVANDTSDNRNATEKTFFSVELSEGNSGTFVKSSSGTTRYSFLNGTLRFIRFNDALDALVLNNSNNGSFTSQIFDAGNTASWNRISWASNAYGELPDNQANESSFISGNLDMRSNVLLMHLNEGSGTIQDSSGKSNSGTVTGATYGVPGKIGTALRFTKPGDRIDVASSPTLNITDGMAIALWVNLARTTHAGWNYFVYDTGFKYEFGIYATDMKPRFKPYNTAGTGFEVAAANALMADRWYHVVTMRNGTGVNLYVNGMLEASRNDFSGELRGNAEPVRIGGDTGAGYFNGTLDEVAIWNRSLSAQEITDLYTRGTIRLNFTVRSCDDTACSGESFTDVLNDTSPQTLSIGNNRYFQYNASFTTDNTTYTPELYNVTINVTTADLAAPQITSARINSTSPVAINTIVKINASVIDGEGNLQKVLLEVLPPLSAAYNTTPQQNGNEFFNTTLFLNETGSWQFRFFANDTANNRNSTLVQDAAGNTIIKVGNSAPIITFVSSVPAQSITESTFTPINFSFTAFDADGFGDLDNATAQLKVNLTGEAERSTSCTPIAVLNASTINYTCTIRIWYFDGAGFWAVNTSIRDKSAAYAENLSTSFQLLQTTAMTMSPTALAWPTVKRGNTNQTANNDPLIINNTGNKDITVGNVTITAFDLQGLSLPTDFIRATNFTLSIQNGTSDCSGPGCRECSDVSGSRMLNASALPIIAANITAGNNSLNDLTGTSGQEALFMCLLTVPLEIEGQLYDTTGPASGAWIVEVS
ncbi:MAG: LamG-like jellyroll fold domain-containing protein [Nanoarchaeota archaeon]|nr:LamG-like jellyroll fold domain-containing protein [Nanoarchaeota archaeon]